MVRKKENRVCNICKKDIRLGKEEFATLIHHNVNETIKSQSDYHYTCYHDKFLSIKDVKQRANDLLGMTEGLFARLDRNIRDDEEKEVFF